MMMTAPAPNLTKLHELIPASLPKLGRQKPQRLLDVIHGDESLSLVFEFLDLDLKRYMDTAAIAAANLASAASSNNALGQAGGLDANGHWVPQAQMQPLPHNVVGRGRSKRALPPDLVMVRVADALRHFARAGRQRGNFPTDSTRDAAYRNSWRSCSSDSRTCTLVASCIAT